MLQGVLYCSRETVNPGLDWTELDWTELTFVHTNKALWSHPAKSHPAVEKVECKFHEVARCCHHLDDVPLLDSSLLVDHLSQPVVQT